LTGGKLLMTLKDAKPGMVVKVESIEVSELKERLMSMGMVKGTHVKVLRSAPLGDPLAVSVRSFNMSIRLSDAAKIIVTKIA
jgi:ferrous iron transport protein A